MPGIVRVPSIYNGRPSVPVYGTPGGLPRVLREASAWYDARDLLTSTQQTLQSRVSGGVAQLGSTSGSDTNDPVALVHTGTNRLVLPDNTGNYLSMTNPVGWAAGEYTGVVDATPAVGWDIAGTHRLMLVSDGTTNMVLITNGASVRLYGNSTSINSVGHPTSGRVQWRIKRNASASASIAWRTDGVVDPSASGWTTSASGTLTDGTTVNAYIGDWAGGGTWAGEVFYAAAYDSDGTLKYSFDAATDTAGQSTYGTFTVNRSTTGLTTSVVTRPSLMLDGTDDYVQLPAGDTPTFTKTTGAYTALVVARLHATPAASEILLDCRSTATSGVSLVAASSGKLNASVFGGTAATSASATNIGGTGAAAVYAAVQSAGTVACYTDTDGLAAPVSTTAITTDPLFSAPRVGALAYTVSLAEEFEILAVVLWNSKALSAAELNTVSAYLLGS